MRNRLLFLFSVTFFTLFGAGRSHYWNFVTTDRAGWSYSVDLYSVRTPSPEVLDCRVMAIHPQGGRVLDRWSLDIDHRTLTRASMGRPEPILPGSVADRAIVFFRQNGELAVLPVPGSEGGR